MSAAGGARLPRAKLRSLPWRWRRGAMASPSLAGEAFAPYRLREGKSPEEALAEVQVALARREVQLASLLDIVRQMEAEVQQVRASCGNADRAL